MPTVVTLGAYSAAAPRIAPMTGDDPWSVYDAMAPAFEAHAADGLYNAHVDRPAVLELAGDVQGLQVLDAACGPGLYLAELVRRGAFVTAFDASEEMLALARRSVAGHEARIVRAVLGEPLPFRDGAFDLVLCALAISHVDDRRSAFEELHRVTRPGGATVFSTQHPTTDWLRKGGSYFDVRQEVDEWERFGVTFPVEFWREPLSSLSAAIAEAGFLIERIVEPLPTETVRDRWPEHWEKLHRRPSFLAMRLVRPA